MKSPSPVQILTVTTPNGVLTVAPSRSEAGKAYVLTMDAEGRYVCECPGFQYRGDCAHVKRAGELAHERQVKEREAELTQEAADWWEDQANGIAVEPQPF